MSNPKMAEISAALFSTSSVGAKKLVIQINTIFVPNTKTTL